MNATASPLFKASDISAIGERAAASEAARATVPAEPQRVSGLNGMKGFSAETSDFTLFWKDGKREVVHGVHAADAMTSAGYGGGAVRALDFYASGDCQDYSWDKAQGSWKLNVTQVEPVRMSQSSRRAEQGPYPPLPSSLNSLRSSGRSLIAPSTAKSAAKSAAKRQGGTQ